MSSRRIRWCKLWHRLRR